MKQVNESYFPRGGPKKELTNKRTSLFKKDGHKQKKQIKKKEKEKIVSEEPEQLQVKKIQGLSMNTLVEGMHVIGCVRAVCSEYVSLSLPDGISAQLPMTSVSPAYTQALEELNQKRITHNECPPLSELFQIGEMLCCHISGIEEIGSICPGIYISISPEDVNYGQSHSAVKLGDLLIAAVESREDYGYVMFTGIQGLTTFLKDDEAVKYIESRNHNKPLAIGQVVRCVVTKAVESNSSTFAQLTANPDVVSGSILKSDVTVEKLLPTTRVNVIVKNVESDGLEVKVLGCPTAHLCYITSSHLESCRSQPEHYSPGTKLTATVLYVLLPTKIVFLSLRKELNGIIEQKLGYGCIIDSAKVAAVTIAGIYVRFRNKEDEFKGFISLKHIDGSVGLEELSVKYPVGTELQTRVLNFEPIEQMYICSLEQSFINEKYLTLTDVHVGDIVECTVKKVESAGAKLSLGRLSAFVPAVHVSNFPIKCIETKLTVGQQVKARVWSISEVRNSVIVTLKETLVNNELLVSYEQAREGDQYYGVIRNLCQNGFNVSFCDEVCGFLPSKYIGYAADITKDFVQGQLVKCYILDVDLLNRKLTLGFVNKSQTDQTNSAYIVTQYSWFKRINKRKVTGDAESLVDKMIKNGVSKFASHLTACYETQDYKTGIRLTGRIERSAEDGIYVEFEDNVKGILPGHLRAKYKTGQDVEVTVLWQDPVTKHLYLQPVGIFLEDQYVKSGNDIIGRHVIGRVLFSKPDMAICVLTGKTSVAKRLVYVPRFPNSVLDVKSEHILIVQNVIDDCIICLVREELIKMYNDNNLEVPEHISNIAQLKIKGKCVNEIGQFSAKKYKQGSEDNYGSKSNKRNKRKSEESFIDDSGEEGINEWKSGMENSLSLELRQTKKAKSKTRKLQNKQTLEDSCVLTLSEVGFSWDAKPEDLMGAVSEPAAVDDSEEDEEESIKKLKNKSRMTAAQKRAAAKEEELMLRKKETELLEAEVNPQSADQFDRILLSNPENAELWIKYMAYHLQATEIEKARSVARRALQTMSYRSEGERLNVWIALLNLENMYGTQESLKQTLDEALKTNDDYLVNSRMLEIYANSNKSHDLEQLVNIMLRKYREFEECWLLCCTNLMNCCLYDKARNVLQRALSSLKNKAHVNLISKFALLENKHGFKEKAVTLLENVLITYPGRVDVWCVYVDMLVKLGDVKQAREVLERAANQKLTARKMKSIYSKWLSFEEKFGDENSVQHVKEAALRYVNTITSKLE